MLQGGGGPGAKRCGGVSIGGHGYGGPQGEGMRFQGFLFSFLNTVLLGHSLRSDQGLLLAPCSGIAQGGFGGVYGMLGMVPGATACKENAHLAVCALAGHELCSPGHTLVIPAGQAEEPGHIQGPGVSRAAPH